jgi:hypothetical protein
MVLSSAKESAVLIHPCSCPDGFVKFDARLHVFTYMSGFMVHVSLDLAPAKPLYALRAADPSRLNGCPTSTFNIHTNYLFWLVILHVALLMQNPDPFDGAKLWSISRDPNNSISDF